MESITQRRRRTLLIRHLGEECSDLGFVHEESNYFSRNRGAIQDVFFFQQTLSNNQYTITYGINCPHLAPEFRCDSLGITITPPPSGRLENDRSYGCKYAEHILSSTRKVRSALESEAEPWLQTFESEFDFVEEYKNQNIRMNEPPCEPNLFQRLRIIQYGTFLYDMGAQEEAMPWLNAALAAYRADKKLKDYERDWIDSIENRIRRD